MFHQASCCAGIKPIVVRIPVVQRAQQAEWGVNVLAVFRKVVSVVILLQQGVRLVGRDAQRFGPFLHAGAERGVQLLLRDAAKPGIVVEHGDLVQVVQLGKNAELGEFRYARDEHEAQIGPFVLQHLEKLAEHFAHGFSGFRLVHQVHDGRVVFVENDYHLLARLFVGPVNQTPEPFARSFFGRVAAVQALVVTDVQFQRTPGFGNATVLQSAQDEVEHGMLPPLPFALHDFQSLEKLLLCLEIRLERVTQQGFSEAARTCKENITISADQVKHHVCLVNVYFSVFADVLKLVGVYGV